MNPAAASEPLTGQFGGDRTNASFSADGARLDFDCATAEIVGAVHPGSDGRFAVTGRYLAEHSGPIEGDVAAKAVEATFEGLLRGDRLELTMKVEGRADAEHTTLQRGQRVKLVRCL